MVKYMKTCRQVFLYFVDRVEIMMWMSSLDKIKRFVFVIIEGGGG